MFGHIGAHVAGGLNERQARGTPASWARVKVRVSHQCCQHGKDPKRRRSQAAALTPNSLLLSPSDLLIFLAKNLEPYGVLHGLYGVLGQTVRSVTRRPSLER